MFSDVSNAREVSGVGAPAIRLAICCRTTLGLTTLSFSLMPPQRQTVRSPKRGTVKCGQLRLALITSTAFGSCRVDAHQEAAVVELNCKENAFSEHLSVWRSTLPRLVTRSRHVFQSNKVSGADGGLGAPSETRSQR